ASNSNRRFVRTRFQQRKWLAALICPLTPNWLIAATLWKSSTRSSERSKWRGGHLSSRVHPVALGDLLRRSGATTLTCSRLFLAIVPTRSEGCSTREF